MQMVFYDTHSHIYDEAFASEEDLAVQRAVEAGVSKIIFPNIDSQTRAHMFSVAERHPGVVFPCLGLHPTSIDAGWKEEMERMEEYKAARIHAIGEIGIDCYLHSGNGTAEARRTKSSRRSTNRKTARR